MKITHRQRIESVLSGKNADLLPVAFWRHFPVDDQQPERLAAATINFQDTYEMDIIKVSPSSSFCLRDWGIRDEWVGNSEGTRDYISNLTTSDLGKLPVLNPEKGSLANQLKTLTILQDYYSPDTPIIQTIFSPLAQLKNILGKNNLTTAIRKYPEKVKTGLEVITNTTNRFMEKCTSLSIDGFFYAVQHASSDHLSKSEFVEFSKSYDERLFSKIEMSWLNVLHVHGRNIYFDEVLDYPHNIINWHDRETHIDLKSASKQTSKVLCGGLSRIKTMVQGDTDSVKSEIDDAVRQVRKKNFILGTGCVLPIITPYGNIKYAMDYTRSL